MGFRRNFIAFTGAMQILFSLVMCDVASVVTAIETANTLAGNANSVNNAYGTPLWGSLIIIMCGVGNLMDAYWTTERKRRTRDYWLSFSVGAFIANLVAFIFSALIVSLYSWAMMDAITEYVVTYSTIIVASGLILIFSVVALFVDCFAICFSEPRLPRDPPSQRSYYEDFDGHVPRPRSNPVFQP